MIKNIGATFGGINLEDIKSPECFRIETELQELLDIATAVGGVTEVVRDDENGLLVPPGDADALATAITRFFSSGGLNERLRAAAVPSIAAYAPEVVYGKLEEILLKAVR